MSYANVVAFSSEANTCKMTMLGKSYTLDLRRGGFLSKVMHYIIKHV